MIVNEYIILSIMGRSGTTILRNELGKYENICCLTTPAQINIYKSFSSNLKFCSYFIKKIIDNDIVNLYGIDKRRKDWKSIDTIIFKMTIHTIDINLLKYFYPLLIVRNPIINVLSASSPKFISLAMPTKKFLNLILNSYHIFNIPYPKKLIRNFEKKNIIEQNAIIYKLSFNATFYYLNNIYKNKYLLIKYEDLLNNPIKVLSSVLEYLGNKKITINDIKNKLNENFYKNVYEEGGILMSKSLSSDYRNRYNNIDQDIKSFLNNFLKKEISFLDYSLL